VATEITGGMTADERTALERFPVVAEEFCHLVDYCGKRNQLVQELAVHLPRLCEVAARLPQVQPATGDINDTPEDLAAHTEEWAKLSGKLREIFGPLDLYWEVFDPTQKEEPVSCSLAIDILKFYLDLKDALKLQKSGAALNDLYWQWRFDSHSHWSKHATSALRTLFHILDLA
jgi:uncharacterized protein DUF5063